MVQSIAIILVLTFGVNAAWDYNKRGVERVSKARATHVSRVSCEDLHDRILDRVAPDWRDVDVDISEACEMDASHSGECETYRESCDASL